MTKPSLRSARESFRWLITNGGVQVGIEGLFIRRDSRRPPSQLDVDEVLDRHEVLGVPNDSICIAFMQKKRGPFFEIQVDNTGLDHLAEIYPILEGRRAARCHGRRRPACHPRPVRGHRHHRPRRCAAALVEELDRSHRSLAQQCRTGPSGPP